MREEERVCSPFRWASIVFVGLTLLVACDAKSRYAGIYRSERQEPITQKEIILELRENGEGLWKVAQDEAKDTFDEVRFVWYVKRGELRINTAQGGVIIGKVEKDRLQITLPNSRSLSFRKQQ